MYICNSDYEGKLNPPELKPHDLTTEQRLK